MNRLINAIVMILALPPCLWVIATAYMNFTGIGVSPILKEAKAEYAKLQ